MSTKIKMKDIHDERDDDIIELSDEELKEILADDDFDNGEEYGEIPGRGRQGQGLHPFPRTAAEPHGQRAERDEHLPHHAG